MKKMDISFLLTKYFSFLIFLIHMYFQDSLHSFSVVRLSHERLIPFLIDFKEYR